MKDLIANFNEHISEALENIKTANFKKPQTQISNVLITGLGGSGIGGTIVAEMAAPIASVPIVVNKDYNLPGFVNENTLVIACSYSGNTEETLSATEQALHRKAEVACITSGGKLLQIAEEHELNVITMQGGNPPRSMFAFAFSYLCYIIKFYGVAGFDVEKNLEDSIKLLNNEEGDIINEAQTIANKLHGKINIFYAVNGGLGIASRWRQQINENAKMLGWEAEIPEMNHNELVGWEGGNDNYAAVFLRNQDDYFRNQKRIEINKKIIQEKSAHVLEVWSKGNSAIEKTLYLVHFGDWVSYYLAEMNGADILNIKSIDLLKSELSKVPM